LKDDLLYKYIVITTSIIVSVLFLTTWMLFIMGIGIVYIEDPIIFTLSLGLVILWWKNEKMLDKI